MTFFTPLIILILFLINYYLYKKDLYKKNLYITIFLFLIIYIIFSIFIFYNNISNGFSTGILYGDVLNNHFCDEYKYLIDSEILYNHFKNGDFNLWITHQLPTFEFIDVANHPSYGNYNIFVIILSLLRLIGINTALDFILIKLAVYIPTAIFLYKLSRIYLNEKFSLISVVIFSILPGYILTNTLLMRDNIILCVTFVVLYYLLSKKYKVVIIPLLLLLLGFRSYLILTLLTTVVFLYNNNNKLISFKDIFFIVMTIIAILFFTNYKFTLEHSNIFFSYYQIQALQENFLSVYGSGLAMLMNFLFSTVIQIVFDPLFINFLTSGLLYPMLISLGNILSILISLLFAICFLTLSITNKNKKIIYLLKFSFYFTLLNALIVMAKDTFIINRIALMWLPLFIIAILFIINNKKKQN